MTARANGLFRATGKKAKPVVRLIDGEVQRTHEQVREQDDFYPTPPEPTLSLLAAEKQALRRFDKIWEPAVGDGAMQRLFEQMGFDVFGSDLIDRGAGAQIKSFYEFDTKQADAIVTNPPFKECHDNAPWVLHALEVLRVKYLALFLPFTWPGAASRAATWAKYPPRRVYLMRWRIDFSGQGAPPMLNAWFVWDDENSGPTELLMMDKQDPAQADIFGAA